MSEDTEELEYWPEGLKRVRGKRPGTWRWIDERTGKQTYPSWAKKSQRSFITPDDMGVSRTRATPDQEEMKRIILNELHILGIDAREPVKTDVITEIIAEHRGFKTDRYSGRNRALAFLREMWTSGLVQLEGVVHAQSGRAMRQKWLFD